MEFEINSFASFSETHALILLKEKSIIFDVAPISDQMFNLYANLLMAIGVMRYGDDWKKPNLKKPITFDFSTEADYIERLKVAHEASAAPIVIMQILKEFLGTIYF